MLAFVRNSYYIVPPNYQYLQDAVQWVESDRRPGRQRLRRVVLVVKGVHVFVEELVRMQRSVHPIDLQNARMKVLTARGKEMVGSRLGSVGPDEEGKISRQGVTLVMIHWQRRAVGGGRRPWAGWVRHRKLEVWVVNAIQDMQ